MANIDDNINHVDQLNPNAPAALAHFAFLIGRWKCQGRLILPSGEWQTFQATWLGSVILNGHAIADEYRMTDATGELIVLGMNFRSFDTARQVWNIKWLNAITGTWTDLASEEMGGVTIASPSIIYAFKEPVAAQAYTRATYTSISPTHFTWRGDKSDDGKSWSDFMIVDCHRTNP